MASILIVDDDRVIRNLLGEFLTAANHSIVVASDGIEGLETFKSASFDLVITDVDMPRLNGDEMLRNIKRISPDTPVIIMTGRPSLGAAVECIKIGATDYLSKPLELPKLKAIVDSALAESETNNPEKTQVISPHHNDVRYVGDYKLLSLLGRGQYGVVYLATKRDNESSGNVALKVMREALQGEVRTRFAREAEVLDDLDHPNIVGVYDFDVREDSELPYIAMEYIDGDDMNNRHEELQALDYITRAKILRQIAFGLKAAHDAGLYHRDLKPHNILLTDTLQPKITDFGIVHTAESSLTMEGSAMGSPQYMAPESFGDGTVDQRSDLFSFGIVAYRLLTGEQPFSGKSIPSLAFSIANEAPPAPSSIHPDFPHALEAILGQLLQKEKDHRYQSADMLIADFDRYLESPDASSADDGIDLTLPLKDTWA